MPLELPRYVVYVVDHDTPSEPDTPADQLPVVEHIVTIHHADQLRAELEMAGQLAHVPMKQAQLHLTSAWCWASLVRQGLYSGPWQRFQTQDCRGIQEPTEDQGGGMVTVDPTKGGGRSATSSPGASPAPALITGPPQTPSY